MVGGIVRQTLFHFILSSRIFICLYLNLSCCCGMGTWGYVGQEMSRGRGTTSSAARNVAAAAALQNPSLLSLLPPAAKAQVADYRARFGAPPSKLLERALADPATQPAQLQQWTQQTPAALSASPTAPAAQLTAATSDASRRKL
jgi:hypothetical protein